MLGCRLTGLHGGRCPRLNPAFHITTVAHSREGRVEVVELLQARVAHGLRARPPCRISREDRRGEWRHPEATVQKASYLLLSGGPEEAVLAADVPQNCTTLADTNVPIENVGQVGERRGDPPLDTEPIFLVVFGIDFASFDANVVEILAGIDQCKPASLDRGDPYASQ